MIQALKKKFIFVNMLLVSLVLITVFTALGIATYQQIKREGDDALQMALSRMDNQRLPLFEIGRQTSPEFSRLPEFNRSPVFVIAVNFSGSAWLQSAENISVPEEEIAPIAAAALSADGAEGALREYNLRFLKRDEPGGVRIAFLETSDEQSAIRSAVLTSASLTLVSIAAFFAVSLFLSGLALKPVEIAWRQQRQFVSDASHELKTPLTVILANLGILKANQADSIAAQMNWVENSETEARRMAALVDNLLFLAKTDEAKTPALRCSLNFSDLVCSTALAFEALAFERDVTIRTDELAQGISLCADEGQLKQLVSILLDNAVKYAAPGGAVTVSLKAQQARAVLSVHNMGSPLSPEEASHLFERFYRADRSRANPGYGLGLSIAKSIVDIHQGKISVESRPDHGTTFTVSFTM